MTSFWDYFAVGVTASTISSAVGALWTRMRRRRVLSDRAFVRAVHQAMQDAPHDGHDYRQARAAIAAVEARLR
jgi:hypothetical protein